MVKLPNSRNPNSNTVGDGFPVPHYRILVSLVGVDVLDDPK